MNNQLLEEVGSGHYAGNLDAEPGETYDQQFESIVREMLVRLGENPEREGLARTPLRVAKAMDFLTSGYDMTVDEVVRGALFEECCEDMVVVKDIEFYSLCEHHMLPFSGHAHVGYLPNGKIIGLSKVARVIDVFARRLQVQERLTSEVADTLFGGLKPVGVMVVMEAEHTCMTIRGVKKPGAVTITSAIRGGFRKDSRTRAEAMALIREK